MSQTIVQAHHIGFKSFGLKIISDLVKNKVLQEVNTSDTRYRILYKQQKKLCKLKCRKME